MLNVNRLTIRTHKNRILIDHLSFTCLKKEKIAVIGEEGNGKSTLLKVIVNPDMISEYAVTEGVIDTGNAVIGWLPQTLDEQWKSTSGLDFLMAESPEAIPDYERIGEALLLMDHFHAKEALLEQVMSQLSGGERVKMQLIKLVMRQPDLILMDEPTNDLDIETLELLEQFILESEAAVLFISHDETLLERCATGILHLEQIKRKTEARGTFCRLGYEDYLKQRQSLAEKQDQLSVKEHQEHARQEERYRRLYQQVDHALNSVSRQQPHAAKMLKRKMKSVKNLGVRLDQKELTHKFEGEEQIDLFFDGEVRMDRHKRILELDLPELRAGSHLCARNVQLKLIGNEKTALIGANGCGKTTLLRCIWERLRDRPDLKVGYIPQNYEELLPEACSPVDYLAKDQDKDFHTRIQNHLGSLKFTAEEMSRPMKDYSSGQKAKVLLVKLVVDQNDVLLLDEPTRNLSPLSARLIRTELKRYRGCILAVSHDRKFLDEVTPRHLRLTENGLEEDS